MRFRVGLAALAHLRSRSNSVSRRDSVPTNWRSLSLRSQAIAFSVAGVRSNCASSVPGGRTCAASPCRRGPVVQVLDRGLGEGVGAELLAQGIQLVLQRLGEIGLAITRTFGSTKTRCRKLATSGA
jgi:hypothetical protein